MGGFQHKTRKIEYEETNENRSAWQVLRDASPRPRSAFNKHKHAALFNTQCADSQLIGDEKVRRSKTLGMR